MDKKLIKLQQKARNQLIRKANRQAEKLLEILRRYEADIISHLAKQPKASFEGFRLQKILEKIKERTKQLKEEIKDSQNQNAKETLNLSIEQAKKLLEESFKLSVKERKALENLFNQLPEEAILFLEEYNLTLSGELTKDIYKRIKQKLQIGLLEGKTIPQMARDISLENLPAIPPFKNPFDRAKTIARTETARAYHNGQILTYKKFGVEEIIIICGKTPCPICQSHCDTVHPIQYADEVLKHPNCTCTFAPIKRKGKKLNTGNYYEEKKSLTEKKLWTLKTAKSFYKEVETKFKNVKTTREAVEVFKGMFVDDIRFYKHIAKHIIKKVPKFKKEFEQTKTAHWIIAKQIDEEYKKKFSMDYLKYLFSSLKKPSTVLYYLPDKDSDPYAIIHSKRNSLTLVLDGNTLISIHKLNKPIEEWIEEKIQEGGIVIDAGKDEELETIRRRLSI